MSIKKVINNTLDGELKHAINSSSESKNKENDNENKIKLKEYIRFDISSIDTTLYYNQIAIICIYLAICLITIITGDFLSLIIPIFMMALVILLSSNPLKVENNRFLDVGIWNLINSLNILIKSFNLLKVSRHYTEITDFFTKLFIISLLLSGCPAFNISFILTSFGLCASYLFCFINKDIDAIKKSNERIQEKELLYIVISVLIFGLAFKSNVANTTVFTILILYKYFYNSIKDLEINEIK